MKSLMILSAAAALAGGALGGYVVSSTSSAQANDDASTSVAVSDLQKKCDDLRQQNEVLTSRIAALENRPVVDAPAPAAVERSQAPSDIAPELRDLVASLRDPAAPLPDSLRAEITSVYSDIKAKEKKAQEDERKKRDQERLEQRLTDIAKDLNLNTYQTNELRKTLTALDAKRDEFREKMQSGEFEDMRATFDALRAETKTEMSRYLTNEQIAAYEDKYSFGRRGGPGGGGWGGNRGPGGGGPQGGTGTKPAVPGTPATGVKSGG